MKLQNWKFTNGRLCNSKIIFIFAVQLKNEEYEKIYSLLSSFN